jgi:thiamine pyrophosphate-dependent acetolactate synthase large subunit-like protein
MIIIEDTPLMAETRYNSIHSLYGDVSEVVDILTGELKWRRNTVGLLPQLAGWASSPFSGKPRRRLWFKHEQAPASIAVEGLSVASSTRACHPATALRAVNSLLSEDDTLTIDTGDVTLWSSLCLARTAGCTLSSERMGTMGYAVPAAIASLFLRGDGEERAPKRAIAIAGDGGFQMTCNELATFQQHSRPGDSLVVVVLDNGVLGRVYFGFDDALGCELVKSNFVLLAAAYGGGGTLVKTEEDIPSAIEEARKSEGLFLLHIQTDPAAKARMAKFTYPELDDAATRTDVPSPRRSHSPVRA